MEPSSYPIKVNSGWVHEDTKIGFNQRYNPKRRGDPPWQRFQQYMGAKTVGEYLQRGGLEADLKHDHRVGFISIEGEPDVRELMPWADMQQVGD